MTCFEFEGVRRQIEAGSLYQAQKAFQHSCRLCCYRGYNRPCDHCPIAKQHRDVSEGFRKISVLTEASADITIPIRPRAVTEHVTVYNGRRTAVWRCD